MLTLPVSESLVVRHVNADTLVTLPLLLIRVPKKGVCEREKETCLHILVSSFYQTPL